MRDVVIGRERVLDVRQERGEQNDAPARNEDVEMALALMLAAALIQC